MLMYHIRRACVTQIRRIMYASGTWRSTFSLLCKWVKLLCLLLSHSDQLSDFICIYIYIFGILGWDLSTSETICLCPEYPFVQKATPLTAWTVGEENEWMECTIFQSWVKKNAQLCLNDWLRQVPMVLPNLAMCKIIQDLNNYPWPTFYKDVFLWNRWEIYFYLQSFVLSIILMQIWPR